MTSPPDVQPGDRIRLDAMGPDPSPIPSGTTGTVTRVTPTGPGQWQISVDWDVQRSLLLAYPEDRFTVIARASRLVA